MQDYHPAAKGDAVAGCTLVPHPALQNRVAVLTPSPLHRGQSQGVLHVPSLFVSPQHMAVTSPYLSQRPWRHLSSQIYQLKSPRYKCA